MPGGTKLSSPATISAANYLIINNALCPVNFSKPNQLFSRRPIRCFSKPKFCSIDGVLYSKDMKSLQMCPMSYEGEFKVPDGVEYTSSRAFFSCSLITKIVIPDSVWDIGYESFSQCKNLQTIVIGNGVEEIDEGAFEDCEKLDTVVFGTGLKRIKKHAFHNCKALTKVNLPDGISNYSVTLFEGCSNLSELTMPEWMEKRRLDIMDYAHGKK